MEISRTTRPWSGGGRCLSHPIACVHMIRKQTSVHPLRKLLHVPSGNYATREHLRQVVERDRRCSFWKRQWASTPPSSNGQVNGSADTVSCAAFLYIWVYSRSLIQGIRSSWSRLALRCFQCRRGRTPDTAAVDCRSMSDDAELHQRGPSTFSGGGGSGKPRRQNMHTCPSRQHEPNLRVQGKLTTARYAGALVPELVHAQRWSRRRKPHGVLLLRLHTRDAIGSAPIPTPRHRLPYTSNNRAVQARATLTHPSPLVAIADGREATGRRGLRQRRDTRERQYARHACGCLRKRRGTKRCQLCVD